MEQLQNNGILELVYTAARQNISALTESIRCNGNEPSEFQKQFKQQTKAAESTTIQEPKEKVEQSTENPVEDSESAQRTLENEQVVVQHLIAAGVVNITTVDEMAQSQEATVELTVGLNVEQNTAITAGVNVEATSMQMAETPMQETMQQEQGSTMLVGNTSEQPTEAAQETIVVTEQTQLENQSEQPGLQNSDAMARTDAASKTVKEENFKVTDAAEGTQQVFENVQEIPVKVGETTTLKQIAETASVEEQVEVKLSQALEQGVGKVEIQLTPGHLGTVTVELTRTVDGTLSIVLSAENSQTGSLLEKHSSNLQNLLMAGGQERVQIEVHNTQESQQHQQQQDFAEGRNGNQHQQQEQSRREPRDAQDFLQQLRLGLIPMDSEAS